jgi:hypothetical protein
MLRDGMRESRDMNDSYRNGFPTYNHDKPDYFLQQSQSSQIDQYRDKGREALNKFKNLMNFGEGPSNEDYI